MCFIAVSSLQEVVGKCCLKIRKNKLITYQDAFVNKEHRLKGVYNKLFEERQKFVDENYKDYKIEAYCRSTTIKKFLDNGFKIKAGLQLVEKNNNEDI